MVANFISADKSGETTPGRKLRLATLPSAHSTPLTPVAQSATTLYSTAKRLTLPYFQRLRSFLQPAREVCENGER
jgi:hypothetical protein